MEVDSGEEDEEETEGGAGAGMQRRVRVKTEEPEQDEVPGKGQAWPSLTTTPSMPQQGGRQPGPR